MLLDTHIFLWWLADSPRLSRKIRAKLGSPDEDVFVSAASIWEIAIKMALGKLSIKEQDGARLEQLIPACGFTELPVRALHAARVKDLPRHHTDPFDRLLISQAWVEGITIVTADHAFKAYPISTFAA